MQTAPSTILLPYIKHYLFLESGADSVKRLRLFSDGNTGMVFTLKGNLISGLQDNKPFHYLPGSFVYGQLSAYKDLYIDERASLIIVVFHPYGINRLLGIPASELKDGIISTEEMAGLNGSFLRERLAGQLNPDARVRLLNSYFSELASKKPLANQPIIQASIDFIVKNRGTVTISQLVNYTGYTERHIERVFSECIGLAPKKFGNIVQLHHFLKMLNNTSTQRNITDYCYEAGYADQSHLIKVFKKFTGITPSQYLNNTSRLAVNFMEFH